VIERFERLLPLIGHIQIADNPGRGEPGTGEIAYDRVLAAIAASDYAGWIGCEYAPVAGTHDGLTWTTRIVT
jgi:hydroxypyruvate isomerase